MRQGGFVLQKSTIYLNRLMIYFYSFLELSYRELVSPAHLSLIANMSGCFRRTLPQKCSSMCFHKKYRTFDGSCNNLQNPSWGSANSPLQRMLPAQYENGFNTPKGRFASSLPLLLTCFLYYRTKKAKCRSEPVRNTKVYIGVGLVAAVM